MTIALATTMLEAFERRFPPPLYMVYAPEIKCYKMADGHNYCELYGVGCTRQDARLEGWLAAMGQVLAVAMTTAPEAE